MDRGIVHDALRLPSGPCPCCYPTLATTVLITLLFVTQCVTLLLTTFFAPTKSFLRKGLSYLSYLIQGILIILGGLLLLIAYSPAAKNFVFYKFAVKTLLADKAWDANRCELLSGISGRVLEIGPGKSFGCYATILISHQYLQRFIFITQVLELILDAGVRVKVNT